jgi:hypothetical protein
VDVERWCSECAAVVQVEVLVDCDDLGDCEELVCVLCGTGYEVGGLLVRATVRAGRDSAVA